VSATTDPLAPSPADQRRVRRRRWLVAGGVALVLCALFAVWAADDNPPDLTGLRPTPRQLPDDQNAWLVMQQAVALAKWDRSEQEPEDWSAFDAMLMGQQWNDTKATAWLAGREAVWPLLEKAAALLAAQAPVMNSLEDYMRAKRTPTDTGSRASDLLGLSIIRAWALFQADQPDTGIDTLLTTLRVAKIMEESRGGLESFRFYAKHWSAAKALAVMAQHPEVSATTLRRALATLAKTRTDAGEFGQNLRAMLQDNILALDAVDQGMERVIFNSGRPPLPSILSYGVNWPLLFKPHRTQGLLTDNAAGSLRLLNVDWAKVSTWMDSEEQRIHGGSNWRTLNPDNLFGRVLLMGKIIPVSNFLDYRPKSLSWHSAAETVIALRLYFTEQGTLPATLDDLVPAYLPTMPLDYYDHVPIRYSAVNFAVWSVGETNFNVADPNPNEQMTYDEIYFRLDFAAPPRPTPPADHSAQP
jgi:hypothetical protein